MKKILTIAFMCLPLTMTAQTEITKSQADRVAELQAEAAAKAKAAQEAAEAAQKAAREAQEAAEKAAIEAKKAEQAEIEQAQKAKQEAKKVEEAKKAEAAKKTEETKKTETANSDWMIPETKKETAPAVSEKQIREQEKAEKREKDAPYLALDAVPVVDGEIQWTHRIAAPGKSARQLYDTMLSFLEAMTHEENQLERSKVALVNEKQHSIAATFQEWLLFSQSFISLDRAKFSYVLQVNCTNGQVEVTMSRLNYIYEVGGKSENYKAEEWITDKYAVNKKHTKLLPISGKFRRKTIDRKNEIFEKIKEAVK